MTRRRAEALCLSGLGAFGLYSLVLLPVAPSLVGSHPILLEALRGSTVSLVAGGAFARIGEASLVLALLAPLPVLMLADPLLWWAGRIWGPEAADKLLGGRRSRWRDRGVRWAERYGAWLLVLNYFQPIPSVVIYAGAGWTGMSLRRFLLLDLLGTALWVGAVVGLGYAIGQSAVDVARTVGRYSLYLTIAIVLGVVVATARRARGPGAPTPAERP